MELYLLILGDAGEIKYEHLSFDDDHIVIVIPRNKADPTGELTSIPWVEKYRPKKVSEVVLNQLNQEIFQNILNKNYFPNLLIYGPPGSGKTTIIQNITYT